MHMACGTRKTAWKGNVRSHFVHHKNNGVCKMERQRVWIGCGAHCVLWVAHLSCHKWCCKMNNSNTSSASVWWQWWNTGETQWWWWLWFDESTVVICVACGMCILEHLNKSGVVLWLERQAPQLCHSCNTHQVQQSHNCSRCGLEQWKCEMALWVFCVWPWWHALDRKIQTSCTQKHSHSGVSVHVPQIHGYHMSAFLRLIQPPSVVSLSSAKRTWLTSAFFL